MTRTRRCTLETLEDRTAPAIFGQPWSAPRHLTLSFVQDGTSVFGQASDLYATLNATSGSNTWQTTMLRAVEAWAEYAPIDVAVVPDGGQPLGTPGLSQRDPRFGDIRIGAVPMSQDSLALSVPSDPYLAGTLAGDILLNDSIIGQADQNTLYAIMLHEVGHALGLPESASPDSARATNPTSIVDHLSPEDITAIQNLYGQRVPTVDPSSPTPMPKPEDYSGRTPLVAFSEINDSQMSVDYSVTIPQGYTGPATFKVFTARVSLLAPQLSLITSDGIPIASGQATDVGGGVVTVTLGATTPGTTYTLRVQSAESDTFGTGRFALTASFDGVNTVSASSLNAVVTGPFESLSADQISELLRNPQDFNVNSQGNGGSTLATATPLTPDPNFAAGTRFVTVGNQNDSPSVMYYQVTAPSAAPSGAGPITLTTAINALSIQGTNSTLSVVDSQGNVVPSTILMSSAGTEAIQAVGLQPGSSYYIRVNLPEGGDNSQGNFTIVADFLQTPDLMTTFANNSLAAGQTHSAILYIAKEQLFQFTLNAEAANVGGSGSVRMTITDSNGNVVLDTTDTAGRTPTSSAVLLGAGQYSVTFTAAAGYHGWSSPPSLLNYTLQGIVISDPVGPILHDPGYEPIYLYPPDPLYYYYPPDVISILPYCWLNL